MTLQVLTNHLTPLSDTEILTPVGTDEAEANRFAAMYTGLGEEVSYEDDFSDAGFTGSDSDFSSR